MAADETNPEETNDVTPEHVVPSPTLTSPSISQHPNLNNKWFLIGGAGGGVALLAIIVVVLLTRVLGGGPPAAGFLMELIPDDAEIVMIMDVPVLLDDDDFRESSPWSLENTSANMEDSDVGLDEDDLIRLAWSEGGPTSSGTLSFINSCYAQDEGNGRLELWIKRCWNCTAITC